MIRFRRAKSAFSGMVVDALLLILKVTGSGMTLLRKELVLVCHESAMEVATFCRVLCVHSAM